MPISKCGNGLANVTPDPIAMFHCKTDIDIESLTT